MVISWGCSTYQHLVCDKIPRNELADFSEKRRRVSDERAGRDKETRITQILVASLLFAYFSIKTIST